MGMFSKSCNSYGSSCASFGSRKSCLGSAVFAPAPNPLKWELLEKFAYDHGYVLIVKYPDCTNFEGVKCMVYEGWFSSSDVLDPHFQEDSKGPIARFKPDAEGIAMAKRLAQSLRG